MTIHIPPPTQIPKDVLVETVEEFPMDEAMPCNNFDADDENGVIMEEVPKKETVPDIRPDSQPEIPPDISTEIPNQKVLAEGVEGKKEGDFKINKEGCIFKGEN